MAPLIPGLSQEDQCRNLRARAFDTWINFKLKCTAGECLTEPANSLDHVVTSYEVYVEALDQLPDSLYHPPFIMNDLIDTYVRYFNIVASQSYCDVRLGRKHLCEKAKN